MKIQPLSAHIGALVEGIDLANMDSVTFQALYQVFLEYQVVFFRRQSLSVPQHLALGQRFGELEPPHPFFPHLEEAKQIAVIETSPGNPPGESFWHTDLTWQAKPAKCSILHAQHVPPQGGDTLWVSMQAVWQALSAEKQAMLRPLQAVHALHAFAGSRYDHQQADGSSYVASQSAAYPPVIHPLVKQHPETGQETLFINEQFTRSIVGMDEQQSRALLNELFLLARSETFQVRFTWQLASVAIWDNRNTQHYAVTDYGDQPRRLHRVTVRAEEA